MLYALYVAEMGWKNAVQPENTLAGQQPIYILHNSSRRF
jgi:hypothetical protein